MNKNIPPLDLLWLVTETPEGTTHVGGVMLFEKSGPRARTVVRDVVASFRSHQPKPPFNYVPEIGGTSWPQFREVQDWDAAYHIQHLALPADASYEDFLHLIAELHEPSLDRSRPLFRTWVIDGVPGNRFAIYSKVSHSIIDGESGMHRLYASMTTSPRARPKPPTFALDMSPPKSKRRAALAAKASDAGASAAKQLAAIKDVYAYGLRKVMTVLSGSALTGSQPFTAHHSPMNEPLGRSRSYATLSLPLDEMRALGKQYGATLNDMVVTLVDEGVHRYLRETGRPFPHRLVSFCPVSLREKGDLEAATKVTAMYVPMGEHDASIVERVHQVVAAATDAKREMRSMSKDAAMVYAVALLALAQASTASGLGRVTPPIANLVISNVPGADRTMYLHGARLLGMYSASAIAASVGLNVTVSSYDGRMDFGIVGNGATMHSLSSMASHIADAYEELKAATAAGAHRPARKTARRRSGNVARRPSNKAAGWSKPRAAVSPRRKR